jgi:hypothetical protein
VRNTIILVLLGAALSTACNPKAENNATQVEAPLSAEQIPNLIIDATAEIEKNNLGRAIDITYRVTKFDSSNIDAYIVRSQAMAIVGNKTEALNALEAAFAHGLKDLTKIEKQPRLNQLREMPEYQFLISKYGLHTAAAVSQTEIKAGNVSIKEEGGNQVIKAGDISITVPKD